MTTTTAPEGTGERSTEGRGTGQPAGPLVRGSRARAQRDRRDVLRPRLPVRGAGDHRHGRGRAQRPVRLRQPRERDRLARQRARGRGTLCGLPRFAWVPSWKPGGPMATHFAKQAVARTGSSATPADIPILPSKITAPGVPGWALPRPRITKLIAQGRRCYPLTAVIAAAGAGKTMALAMWAATEPGTVAWVCLDEFDNRPGAFWAYVIASLRRAGVALPTALTTTREREAGNVFLLRLASALAAQDPPATLDKHPGARQRRGCHRTDRQREGRANLGGPGARERVHPADRIPVLPLPHAVRGCAAPDPAA